MAKPSPSRILQEMKTEPDEKVGVFCRDGACTRVVEYTELGDRERQSRTESGDLSFRAGNIACHVISVDFVAPPATNGGFELPYHVAHKAVDYFRDGSVVEGPSLMDLLPGDVASDLSAKLESTLSAAAAMKAKADSGEMAYDQMIGEGNAEGNAIVQAVIDGLLDQTKSIEGAVATLELGSIAFEGSDSLDDPEAVFQ